jgi:hypothetical protein
MTVPYSTTQPTGRPSNEGAEFVAEKEINVDDLPSKLDVALPIEAQIRTLDEVQQGPGNGD